MEKSNKKKVKKEMIQAGKTALAGMGKENPKKKAKKMLNKMAGKQNKK